MEEPFEAIIPFCHKISASSHGNQNDFELNIEKKCLVKRIQAHSTLMGYQLILR